MMGCQPDKSETNKLSRCSTPGDTAVVAQEPPSITTDTRGQYPSTGHGSGLGVLALLGIGVGIYAASPGARHWYKHGRLPPRRG